MMRAIVSLCVRHFGAVTALTIVALVLGCWGALRSPLDVFPEFVPSQVDIQTEAPGFAPQQVEELVTKQVENAVNGAAGLATLRSESIPGLSVVTITFADRIDVHVARQGISERLSELGSTLPAGVGTPKLSPLVSSTMDLLKIGLLSDKVDAYELRDTADWIIKPRLLAVPGVAHVIVFGGDRRQIQILPNVQKLASFGITFNDISDAARAALPLRGAGFIDVPGQRILLRSPTPEPDVGAIGKAVVAVRGGTPILLRDIAEVKVAPALRSGDSLVMGKPGVMLSLASQYGANTLTATLAVEKALADLAPSLKSRGIVLYPSLHRPANFIERALGNLKESLVIAAVLILAVLYLFLRDIRASFIAFTAIPVSLLAAIGVLDRMGLTLNTMTLGGFAVALGVLVDDAIIGIENILRRLRENGTLAQPRPRLEVVREASLEVRGPVIYATAVVIAVFLPELFTSSVQGRFVGPLALAFILAVVASLLVAMTSTPALCALWLRSARRSPRGRMVAAPQAMAEGGRPWRRQTFQDRPCVFDFDGAGGPCGAAVRGRHVHAGISRRSFRHAGIKFRHRDVSRRNAGHGEAHQCGGVGSPVRTKHRAAGGPGGTRRGHLGAPPQRVSRRAQSGRDRRPERGSGTTADHIGELPRHSRRSGNISGGPDQRELER